jgi:hypothetical protein
MLPRLMHKVIFFLFVALLSAARPVRAQDSTRAALPDTIFWKGKLTVGANFNQASFSGNWQGGGVNSVALGTLLRAKAEYSRRCRTFTNEIELLYGVVNNAGQGRRKTTDRIWVDSKLGCKFAKTWSLFVSGNLVTQFAPGYQYVKDGQGTEEARFVSKFMTPAFITTAWGFEFRPKEYFYLRLSPVAPRVTIVNDTTAYRNVPANYGVPVGRRTRYEWLSSQVLASYDRNVTPTLNLKGRYLLFANLQNAALNQLDHRLDLSFTSKVNKYINVNLTGILLYDRDQDKSVQLSQALAVGLVYTKGK